MSTLAIHLYILKHLYRLRDTHHTTFKPHHTYTICHQFCDQASQTSLQKTTIYSWFASSTLAVSAGSDPNRRWFKSLVEERFFGSCLGKQFYRWEKESPHLYKHIYAQSYTLWNKWLIVCLKFITRVRVTNPKTHTLCSWCRFSCHCLFGDALYIVISFFFILSLLLFAVDYWIPTTEIMDTPLSLWIYAHVSCS